MGNHRGIADDPESSIRTVSIHWGYLAKYVVVCGHWVCADCRAGYYPLPFFSQGMFHHMVCVCSCTSHAVCGWACTGPDTQGPFTRCKT